MTHDAPLPSDPIAEASRQWAAHGWASAADGMAAVTSIMRAQQLILTRVERTLRPFGLSFARFELLRLLAFSRDGILPMASVIARLQVHPASVTSTVSRLVQDDLIERRPNPADGRAALLIVTDAGRELVERATDALNADVFEQPGLDAPDVADLVQLLARLRGHAGDFSEPTA